MTLAPPRPTFIPDDLICRPDKWSFPMTSSSYCPRPGSNDAGLSITLSFLTG